MEEILNLQIHRKRVGLVYDLPTKLENEKHMQFPDDATAEWESQSTIDFIARTWDAIGFEVILFPLDKTFLKRWSEHFSKCTLVHSLVEGFGSLAREAWIPSLCELSGVPFVGSSPFAHSLCMSKTHTKFICRHLNIPTAPFYSVKNKNDLKNIPNDFFEKGCFVKPEAEGSGMGIDVSHSVSYLRPQTETTVLHLLDRYPDGVLLEAYLSGDEYTSALIGTPAQFLPIAHIEVDSGVYGIANKSKDRMDEKITFPSLDPAQYATIEEGTKKLFSYLQMHDFVRMDWKCDSQGNVYFLEANTLAGLSYYYSVLPLMAQKAGLSYPDLLKTLADSALLRSHNRNLWYGKARVH